MFSDTQKPTPTVFNLQALDWVHCEEETDAYYQLYDYTLKFVKNNLQRFKFGNFAKKRIFQKIHFFVFFFKNL